MKSFGFRKLNVQDSVPITQAVRYLLCLYRPFPFIIAFFPFCSGMNRLFFPSGFSVPHRTGFIRCESRTSRLIRRLEVHFLQILPSQVKRNWQEEPSYEAVPTTVHCISKTPKRFRRKGIEKREINNQ